MPSTTSVSSLVFLSMATCAATVDVDTEEHSWSQERRRLSFEGLSYEADRARLGRQIDRWTAAAKRRTPGDGRRRRRPRALIVPHTALRCCGSVAASAFALVDPGAGVVRRVFLVGPSHRFHFPAAMLTRFRRFETPFGDLEVDAETGARLAADGPWDYAHQTLDLMEHSLENVLPFVGRALGDGDALLVPIVTGHLTARQAKAVADKLAGHLAAEDCLFVISTELSHRGRAYGFDDADPTEAVRRMDRAAMDAIAAMDEERFRGAAAETNICGEVPLDLLLRAARTAPWNGSRPELVFLDYTVGTPYNDSYVGCAAAALFPPDPASPSPAA